MNIQIYGSGKCFDTKKAERYFKERGIKFQLIDLHKYGMGPREFEAVRAQVGLDAIVNTKGRAYEELFIQYLTPEAALEKILENPKVLNTPIVRNGRLATVGYKPEVWKEWT